VILLLETPTMMNNNSLLGKKYEKIKIGTSPKY
jgi:hypothetical protein